MTSADPVLVDTHVAVWWVSRPAQLSATARATLAAAETVAVSVATAWELALLVDARRLELDRPVATWMHDATREAKLRPLPVDVDIAIEAVDLGARGFHRDPADRFIYATATRHRMSLVSKDQLIQTFAEYDAAVTVIW